MQFHDDGKPDRLRRCRCFFLAVRDPRLHGRNSAQSKQLFGFVFRQQSTPTAARFLNNGAYLLPRLALVFRAIRQDWRFINAAKVVGVAPHQSKNSSGGVGISKGWNSRSIQNDFAARNSCAPHPAREQWLAMSVGMRL